MAYEVLARKWRPQVFQDVIGQEHITQTLVNAVNSGRIAHAYLFSGARGVGKTSVARILAKAINCSRAKDGNPCNECDSCKGITEGSSVDVQEIDGASNRGIDEIRELRENIKYMPSSGKFRVYIIDEVHMLTLPAFNALLKSLEEPPPHVKFVFATTEPHKVPITILSRCQRFDFKRIPLNKIVQHLGHIADKEKIEINKSGLALIAGEAEGSMRDAESLMDQVVSYTGSKVEDKNISDILGIVDRELIFDASGAIIEGAADRCVDIVDRIYTYGYDIKEFYRALMDQFRNLLVCLVAPQNDLIDMTEDDRNELKIQADKAGLERLQQTLNILIAREEALRFTSHPRLVLETIMIKLCRLGEVLSFGELLKKVESLEKRLIGNISSYSSLPPSGVSESGTEWKKEGDTVYEIQEGGDKDKNWQGLLAYVGSKNRPMANVLKEWRFINFEGNTMELSRGGNSFSSVYLDDEDRLERFLGYCRDFFNRDVKLKIMGNRTGKEEDNGGSGGGNSDLPRPVQEVLDVFKGEIKGNFKGGNKNEGHT